MVTVSHDNHMIDTPISTILVEPDCSAWLTKYGDVKLKVSLYMCVSCEGVLCVQVGGGVSGRVSTTLDAIQLSIFSHRFMSTAEQMGRSPDNHMTCM